MIRTGRLLAWAILLCGTCTLRGAEAAELVDVQVVNPHIRLDLRYATSNNFTHEILYPRAKCYLRKAVADRLSQAQAELERIGRSLKVFDCYRPLSVQKKMWALVPDERYVADPAKGSRHNRGAAVDLTVVDANGREVAMPTAFDDFTERAHRDFFALPAAVIQNRWLLERVMAQAGFAGLPTEWWHFDAEGWSSYDVLDVDLTEVK
jgi:D-alanyl-D-alanine dipeptidase